MRKPPDVDADSTDRLAGEAAGRRSVLAPTVVPVNLTADPIDLGEELPFAPGSETGAREVDSTRGAIVLSAAFRWRRPLMVVLAVAVAGSVMLAARRDANVDTEGRASGAMSAAEAGDDGGTPATADGNVAVQASSGGIERQPDAGATESDADSAPSSTQSTEPLQVTSPPLSSTTTIGSTGRRGTASGSTAPPTSTPTSSVTTGDTATSSTAGSTSTVQPSTTIQPSTARPPTTERASTTTERATTIEPTTTARPTTMERTTTTVVLVGSSAGGFENPSIGRDMDWLNNGQVGRWQSSNGDIQLMRSGFEGIESLDGGQYAELNSSSQGGLYQNLSVKPGTTVEWEFLHRARSGTERIEVRIGPQSNVSTVDTVRAKSRWVSHRGRWRVPDGVTAVRFMLWSTESGPYGNLVDGVRISAVER